MLLPQQFTISIVRWWGSALVPNDEPDYQQVAALGKDQKPAEETYMTRLYRWELILRVCLHNVFHVSLWKPFKVPEQVEESAPPPPLNYL
eukprot:jgi/Botrbrau1/6186/Bobra.0344s0026.1